VLVLLLRYRAGCDPLAQEILIVKSTNHFFPAFDAVSSSVLYVDTVRGKPKRSFSILSDQFDSYMCPEPVLASRRS
jgi:microcystin degradation protein MlrC